MSFDGNVLGVAVVVGVALVFIFFALSRTQYQHVRLSFVRDKVYKFPPSPPSNSIMGHHCWQDKQNNLFLTIESWIERYGPIISLRTGTERYVVIGRYKAAMDILQKQGGATAERPQLIACNEMLGGGFRITFTAGKLWIRIRRALHTHLQPKAVQTYRSLMASHAKRLIRSLLESPEQFDDLTSGYVVSVLLNIFYGNNMEMPVSHPRILEIQASSRRIGVALDPGSYLVDSFPWLKYIPWYGRELRRAFANDCQMFHRMLDDVELNNVNSCPNLAKSLLTREIDFGFNETQMAFIVGGSFSAGWLAIRAAVRIIMMAAARYPDVQAAIHAELDAVVGNSRLPTFDDEKSLPLLCAFMLECHRMRPVVAPGLAHRATEDIVWGDYHIPAGTRVFGVHWSISRDPEVFPNPNTFDVKRWLTPDGSVREDLKFPAFGFGRRVCPGQHVSPSVIYMFTALVLWSFRITVDDSAIADDPAFLSDGAVGLHFEPRMQKDTLKTMMEE